MAPNRKPKGSGKDGKGKGTGGQFASKPVAAQPPIDNLEVEHVTHTTDTSPSLSPAPKPLQSPPGVYQNRPKKMSKRERLARKFGDNLKQVVTVFADMHMSPNYDNSLYQYTNQLAVNAITPDWHDVHNPPYTKKQIRDRDFNFMFYALPKLVMLEHRYDFEADKPRDNQSNISKTGNEEIVEIDSGQEKELLSKLTEIRAYQHSLSPEWQENTLPHFIDWINSIEASVNAPSWHHQVPAANWKHKMAGKYCSPSLRQTLSDWRKADTQRLLEHQIHKHSDTRDRMKLDPKTSKRELEKHLTTEYRT